MNFLTLQFSLRAGRGEDDGVLLSVVIDSTGEGAARAVVICLFLSAFALLYFRAVTQLSKRMST